MVVAERAIIHPATRAMKALGGHISLEQAVDELIAGIARGQALIVLGGKARLTFWMRRLVPPSIWYAISDGIIARALRAGSPA